MTTETKLYTLHTRASYAQVSEIAILIATRTGHTAMLEEQPNGYVVMAPPRSIKFGVWTRGRWIAVLAALSVAPFAFRLMPNVNNGLAGYGIGWIVACVVLLWRRS